MKLCVESTSNIKHPAPNMDFDLSENPEIVFTTKITEF